jgi:hypothetical protein
MEGLEAEDGLNEYAPDFVFFEEFLLLLVVDDLLVEVSVVGELHDDAAWGDRYHRFLLSRNTSL